MLLPTTSPSSNTYKYDRKEILRLISDRESEFLKLVCDPQEYTYKRIAYLMNIGEDRVNAIAKNLFKKFDIKSKSGLVLFALKWQLN